MSKTYENGRVYYGPPALIEQMMEWVRKPLEYKRELPVFGLPGIRYRNTSGAQCYRWSTKLKEPPYDEANHRQ